MYTAVMAALVLLAMGIDEVFADHEQDRLIQDFGELLEGAEASLLTTQGEIESITDESATIPTELIVAQTAYLEAFEEVIQKQIFWITRIFSLVETNFWVPVFTFSKW